jgi:hypothetical protein
MEEERNRQKEREPERKEEGREKMRFIEELSWEAKRSKCENEKGR